METQKMTVGKTTQNNDWAYYSSPMGNKYRAEWITYISDLKRLGWNLPDQKNRDRLDRAIAELNSLLDEAVAYEKAQAEEGEEDDN